MTSSWTEALMSIDGEVAVDERVARVLEVGEAVAQRVDLRVDGIVVDLGARHLDPQPVVALRA